MHLQSQDGVLMESTAPRRYTTKVGRNELQELLNREPFEAFRIHVSSGDMYEVKDPQSVVVMRSRLFIAFPGGDRWTFVPFLHISAVESLGNGRAHKPRKRKRR